ncbi:30S ribosomal protein S17 [Candidatus Woesearchaeota archaeon]|nr:30S ribosomal protein S17 [Candidatus Woesearchaeota archaeon]
MVGKNTKSKAAQDASTCTDKNCPIHGTAKVRGRALVGTITSDKMSKTVVVAWTRKFFVKKYERYEVRKSKINAHNPECINAKKGDRVKIVETRPLSKTKHFIVTEILGAETKKEHVKSEEIAALEAHQEARDSARQKIKEKPTSDSE